MESTVTEIHDYPLRPAGFVEPLFWGSESRRAVMEHLAASTWLSRATELVGESADLKGAHGTDIGVRSGRTARAVNEPVKLERSEEDEALLLFRSGQRSRCRSATLRGRPAKRAVRSVEERSREVRDWWDEEATRDLLLYRLALSDGSVVDVAKDRSTGEWSLLGVVD